LPADYQKRDEGQRRIEQNVSKVMRAMAEQRALLRQREPGFWIGRPKRAAEIFEAPCRVLHIDGDPNYLRKSMALYSQLKVPANGYYIQESQMVEALHHLLPQVKPDIVVLTGHDGILKEKKQGDLFHLSSYKNSHNFVLAVQAARQYERSKDSLVIVAGACQSHFEALMNAGANYASSPGRVLIHAFDPLYVAARVAYTSIRDTVHITDVMHHTMSGLEGMGGLESRGFYRVGIPRSMVSALQN
jgi:spore coat assembly protein